MKWIDIKFLIYVSLLAASISLVTYGSKNGVSIYVTAGIGIMIVMGIIGVVESVRDLSREGSEDTENSLNELNSAEGRKFIFVLAIGLVLMLAFWGLGYSLVIVNIESFVPMLVAIFSGIIGSYLAIGAPLVWYISRLADKQMEEPS